MLQRAFVLLGMAILLSLLFPLKLALREGGIDPLSLPLNGLDLAGVGALLAVPPSLVLCRHGQLAQRTARWNLWLALLAVFAVVFLLLHVSWSRELATAYVRQAVDAGGLLPVPLPYLTVMSGAELASRVGVLVCMVGVLVNLQAAPEEGDTRPRRKK